MKLSTNLCLLCLFVFLIFTSTNAGGLDNTSFYQDYYVTWGSDHLLLLNQETEIQLSLDQNSGAGFESKLHYGSGSFHMRIKLPDKNSIGVVTAFYLYSRSTDRDELDFEFLGSNGPPYTLQTNVYVNGQGGREQRTQLWFDPTNDFHSYKILWNQHQTVFYVDDIPIRVFKNNTKIGLSYPSQPMQVEGSLWNGEGWASDGRKTDWSQAPFKAYFQRFNVDGCVLQTFNTTQCYSSTFWWNSEKLQTLDEQEQRDYERVTKQYMSYDYCSDRSRYPQTPPECQSNQY
ncbi:hypothetical protein FH972_018788 [Carpinus fangiana]|uniref:Xyloglucan endotransglucosylase/hydrolase n=1 Tax=Carpinus fangiana TaxID=176857 RepID=A0A5N6RNA2_9ROSI|nr:hypothetical protein FH972_018788 [Carpinus fangiana]